MYSWLIIIRAGPTQKTSTSSSLCRIHLPRDPIDSLLIIAVRNWASVTFHIYQVGFNYFRIWIANMHLRGLDQFQDQKDHQVCSSKDWTRPSAKIIHHLMNYGRTCSVHKAADLQTPPSLAISSSTAEVIFITFEIINYAGTKNLIWFTVNSRGNNRALSNSFHRNAFP